MSKPVVYFTPARGTPKKNKFARIGELLSKLGVKDRFSKGDLVALKVHWGEGGNADFLPSFYVRHVARAISRTGAKPFVTDTNTLYRGSRHNACDNVLTAAANGFALPTLGCPVVVADGLRGHDYREVPVDGRHTKSARVAGAFVDADGMVVLSHVKGHMVFGFGGALKNLGMGCSAASAKQYLHADVRPRARGDICTGCGDCIAHCRFDAIRLAERKERNPVAVMDQDKCTGCGECIVVCPVHAIPIDWGSDYVATQEKTAEYAAAALAGKGQKAVFLNFLTSITPDCDCCNWSDAPIVPDIGYLASDDPVAVDRASVDLVNSFTGFPDRYQVEGNVDRFKELHNVDYLPTLNHAAALGIGSIDYDLIELE